MAEPTSRALGPGWSIAPAPEGGVDLRVARSGRVWVVAPTAAIALGWTAATFSRLDAGRPLPLGVSAGVGLGIALLLALLALWCAFGVEAWHLGPNCLEHRIGIGGWRRARRFEDAELEIRSRFDRLGRPYHRLYAVVGGEQHFLLERRLPELAALADLIAAETGWRGRGGVEPRRGLPLDLG